MVVQPLKEEVSVTEAPCLWEDPYTVVRRLSNVPSTIRRSYRVKLKVVHVNWI